MSHFDYTFSYHVDGANIKRKIENQQCLSDALHQFVLQSNMPESVIKNIKIVERDEVLYKVFRYYKKNARKHLLHKNLTLDAAKDLVKRYQSTPYSFVGFTKQN